MRQFFFRNLSTKTIVLAFFLGSILSNGNVWASLWGVETSTWLVKAPSYWGGSNSQSTYDSDGGEGVMQAYSSVGDYRGSGQAFSQLQAADIMPVLKADAYVDADDKPWGSWSTVWAIEGYTYGGSDPKQFELTANLTGEVNNPSNNETKLRAEIWVFGSENFGWSHDPGTLIYEMGAVPKAESIMFDYDASGSINANDSISFSVDPGETFYVWARLETIAKWAPSYADAYSTLGVQLDSTENLKPMSAVPIPGAIWLLGSGLIGLVGLRRKEAA